MAVTIQKTFEVEQSPERVWEFLTDPGQVVGCLPGARLVRSVDERTHEGEVGVRLGPISASFRGIARYEEVDEEKREVRLTGEGKDPRAGGSVKMEMQGRLEPLEGGGTRVSVTQTVSLTGKLAAFGRGGIVQGVADFFFGRFTECVRKKLEE